MVIVVVYLQQPQQHLDTLDLCLSLLEAGQADQAGTFVFAAAVVSRYGWTLHDIDRRDNYLDSGHVSIRSTNAKHLEHRAF